MEAAEFYSLVKIIKVEMGWPDSKVSQWLNTKNPLLGGWTPLQMIDSGKGEKLLRLIWSQIDENKIEERP